MSIFLCKSIAFGRYRVTTLAQTSHVRWFSASSLDQKHSFTVSYLTNSLGFSPKAALNASRFVKFNSPEKPDKTIEFFKGYGFTHTQISSIVRGHPQTLLFNVEKSVLPKLEFLRSKGISGPELAKGLSLHPELLRRSLAKQIRPAYEFYRNLFQSDEMMIRAVGRFPDILVYDIEKKVVPNICTLKQHGVPDSNIATLLFHWSQFMLINFVRFQEIVKEVLEMGFDSSKTQFIIAVRAVNQKYSEKSLWERKVNAYKKWGWSDEEVMKAFQKNPWIMLLSEKKILALMDFFIDKMGLKPCHVAKLSLVFTFSLEKRIIPRVSYYQVLLSRGMVKEEFSLLALVNINERKFLQKFVTPYAKEAPELLKLYEEKLAFSSDPRVVEFERYAAKIVVK